MADGGIYFRAEKGDSNCSEWLSWPARKHVARDEADHVACLDMSDLFVSLTLIVMIFLTVVGNTLVVLSVAIYKRMRTFTNVLLISLATADFLVGLLVMPIALIDLMQKHHWTFGKATCKFWTTSDVFLCTASILNLCVISLDRYFAITSPLVYTRTRNNKLAFGSVAAVWLLSMVTCSPPLLVPGWQFRFDETYACGYVKAIAYRVYSALCSFYIPLLIMLSVYLKIFRVANNREKMMKSTTNGDNRRSSRGMQIWHGGGGSVSAKSGGNSIIRSTTSVIGRYKTSAACGERNSRKAVKRRNFSSATCGGGGGEDQNLPPTPTRRYRSVEIEQSTVNEISYAENETITCVNEETYNEIQNDVEADYCSESYQNNGGNKVGAIARDSSRNSVITDNVNNGVNHSAAKRVRLIMTHGEHCSTPIIVTTPSIETSTGRSWSSSASLHELIKTKISGSSSGGTSSTGSSRTTREKLMYLKERKALKTIGVVVSGFIICWLPFFVLYIVEVVCDATSSSNNEDEQISSTFVAGLNFTARNLTAILSNSTNIEPLCKIPPILADIFLWLGYSNSAINPLIYTFYHKDFRRCFKDLLCCGCLRRKVNRRMSVRRLHQTRL